MQSNRVTKREHFWDTLRAFLMLLGIPYHVALAYQPGQDFIVHSGEGVPGFSQLAAVLHLWRMPAFFVVAGYFAMLLLARRDPRAWLKSRFIRLGIPLLTCLVTLVPAMNFVCELSNLPFAQAVQSWRRNALSSGGYWVRHLWFIIVLLYFSSIATWLAVRRPGVRDGLVPTRTDRWAARHFGLALAGVAFVTATWEALAVEAFYSAGLATMVPQQILRLDEAIIYAPWFLIGCLLARARETLARVTQFSMLIAASAVMTTAGWLWFHDSLSPMEERFLGTIAALATTQVVIAAARVLLDRPSPMIRNLTDASFVIYLFHLPLITLFVWLAQPLAVAPLVKALAIMVVSLGLSYAIWLVTRRARSMALLFDGIVAPKSGRMTAQPA